MTESKHEIFKYLEQLFPEAETELNYKTAFELIIAVVLSAQCTDERVNKVTKLLFRQYPDARSLANAELSNVENIIYSTGFYRNKAKNIINLSDMIVSTYNGDVPSSLEKLVKLPGVGRKTANVVYSSFFGGNAIAVDTHVFRVARRLNLSSGKTVEEVERDLMRQFRPEDWSKLHSRMVLFGRHYCKSRNPMCENCKLKEFCSYFKENKKTGKV